MRVAYVRAVAKPSPPTKQSKTHQSQSADSAIRNPQSAHARTHARTHEDSIRRHVSFSFSFRFGGNRRSRMFCSAPRIHDQIIPKKFRVTREENASQSRLISNKHVPVTAEVSRLLSLVSRLASPKALASEATRRRLSCLFFVTLAKAENSARIEREKHMLLFVRLPYCNGLGYRKRENVAVGHGVWEGVDVGQSVVCALRFLPSLRPLRSAPTVSGASSSHP
jgi:hypothetical protein